MGNTPESPHHIGPPENYVHWTERATPYLADHKFLLDLSPKDWLSLLTNPSRSYGLIQGPLLEQEYALYNDGATPRPETKILFITADNLQTAKNFDGSLARQKRPKFAKASEHDELLAITSHFIDHYPGTPASKVYSETADVLWNLIQLGATDPTFSLEYDKLTKNFIAAAGLSPGQAGLLTITKYATRLYRHLGQTNHDIEDGLIEQLLFGIPDNSNSLIPLIPTLDENRASTIFEAMQSLVRPILQARLDQIRVYHLSTHLLFIENLVK